MNAPIPPIGVAAAPPSPAEVVLPGFGELVETLLAFPAADPEPAGVPLAPGGDLPAASVVPRLVLAAHTPPASAVGDDPGGILVEAAVTTVAGTELVSEETDPTVAPAGGEAAGDKRGGPAERPAEPGAAEPAPQAMAVTATTSLLAQADGSPTAPAPLRAGTGSLAGPAPTAAASRHRLAAAGTPAPAAVGPAPVPMRPSTELAEGVDRAPVALTHSAAGEPALPAAPPDSPGPAQPMGERAHHAAVDPPLSSAARRVAEAVDRLEHAPPPRSVTLSLDDLDGLRVTVSVHADGVRLVASQPGHETLLEALERAVAARGFDLAGSGEGDRRRPAEPDPIPLGWPATGAARRRPAPASGGIRL